MSLDETSSLCSAHLSYSLGSINAIQVVSLLLCWLGDGISWTKISGISLNSEEGSCTYHHRDT